MKNFANIVICGAGISGISTAYHLAVKNGLKNIVLIDERVPLSLTSDKSTECYRNWWPGPDNAMVALMNRSIDILEGLADESGNIFHLNRRGYLFATGNPEKIPALIRDSVNIAQLGAGELRIHRGNTNDPIYIPLQKDGYDKSLTGADLFLNKALIHKHFPYLSDTVVAALHVRRAGWFSAQQYGQYMLEQSRQAGVTYINQKIIHVNTADNHVTSVILESGEEIDCNIFVNAAGPFTREIGNMMGISIPVYAELHLKVSIHDTKKVVPRNAPLLIWTDEQFLPFNDDERALIKEDDEIAWLLEKFPGGVHTRPEGGDDSDIILLLWEYKNEIVDPPTFPIPQDPLYPEIAIRGISAILPRFQEYFHEIPQPLLDGGYYLRTQENRPIIGQLPIENAYIVSGMSGFGLMASSAAGELIAKYITGAKLPSYAPAFSINRYKDPNYLKSFGANLDTGQL